MAQANGIEQRLAEMERRLGERIAALEQQVKDLRSGLTNTHNGKDWHRTIGMFAGDEVMKQIDEAGRRIREADREKARRAAERADRRAAERQSAKGSRRKRA
jgi:hypothetical protein